MMWLIVCKYDLKEYVYLVEFDILINLFEGVVELFNFVGVYLFCDEDEGKDENYNGVNMVVVV